MRNLRNVQYNRWSPPRPHITSACWDPAKDEIICSIGPREDGQVELLRLSGPPHDNSHEIASWTHSPPNPDVSSDAVVSIHHFSDTLTTCLIFEGGDIYVVREAEEGSSSSGDAEIEIVGSIDAGITAARWSPDDEVLLMTTKADTAVFMGRGLDPMSETPMTAADLAASKHVSVGWGSKETQFRGKGAKALRDPTIPERVDEGVLNPEDGGETTISWRGDGAFVAVNAIEGARRVVRVYSREGVLDSASEPVDGLEGALSWRPAGNLIAGVQRLNDRTDVVFFERNGLRHGQFTLLPLETDGVKADPRIRLEWNSDSTVLAVMYADTIQLWTMGNYHWYLKQEIRTSVSARGEKMDTDQRILRDLVWHPEKALRSVWFTSDSMCTSEYVFNTSRGSLVPPHDHGAVAVIDATRLKVTPFRTANVPPPMSMFELQADGNITDVAFSPDHAAIAVLHQQGVNVFQWNAKGDRSIAAIKLTACSFELDGFTRLQVTFSAANIIAILQSDGEQAVLKAYQISSKMIKEQPGLPLASHTAMALSNSGYSGCPAAVQEKDGKILSLSSNTLTALDLKFPVPCPLFEMVSVDDQLVVFGLSRNGHLYANSRLLVRNCTSFLVTQAHLVFTTTNHFVKFLHLTDPDDLEVPPDDPEKDERCRNIERGAKLVTAIPTNMNLVLQMPRGNLETIFPRAMVLAGIRSLVDAKNYARAFQYCRTQRVDMNILYDHRPAQFLESVGLFLDQVRDISYIDLFLSSLRDEDVTKTMYPDTKPTKKPMEAFVSSSQLVSATTTPSSKVNTICDAVLRSLERRKATNLQNIITAHVCKVPPAIDDGLTLVAELMQENENLAEKAIEHICFLVDVNRLYDHALGLYNLDLTLLVAQQSQRDPREYLPFIQDLHKLANVRRKFQIDDHLGRRTKALAHLKTLDAFDELTAYAKKHVLYQEALKLYRYDQARHAALANLYAEHLELTSKFRDAGLAYESLGNYAKATGCYRAAGASSWQECLYAAQKQQPPLSGAALSELATALADALTEAKDHPAAATIHLDYLSSPETAIRCLCKGSRFADALRLAAHHPSATHDEARDRLLAAADAGIVDALSTATDLLADCKAQLRAQVPRILELRRRAADDPLAFYEGERSSALRDVPDDVSVAASTTQMSTNASLFTRYTGKGGASVGTVGTGVSRATSKNRKREEKKRARGRKGTVYEEEYLVASLGRLVARVGSEKADLEALVFALARRGMAERARALEGLVREVLDGCRAAVAEVFPAASETAALDGADGDAAEESWVPRGADAVYQDHLDARTRKLEAPVVPEFKGLSLLGS